MQWTWGAGGTRIPTNAAAYRGVVCSPLCRVDGAGRGVPGGSGEAGCRQAADMVSGMETRLARRMRHVEWDRLVFIGKTRVNGKAVGVG